MKVSEMTKSASRFRYLYCSIAISSALLAGCAARPVGVINEQTGAPSNAEAVVVHGMKQADFRYIFVKGRIDNGMFHETKHVGVLIDKPSSGYIVGKVEAGDVIALIQVDRAERKNNEPVNFNLGCGKPVRVFNVPGGKVSYLGDAAISVTEDRELRVVYSDTFQDAQSYIDSKFPALRGRLEPIGSQMVPYKCPPTYRYIQIYK